MSPFKNGNGKGGFNLMLSLDRKLFGLPLFKDFKGLAPWYSNRFEMEGFVAIFVQRI